MRPRPCQDACVHRDRGAMRGLNGHTKFPVEVLTPEGEVFSEEVEMLSTVTTVGSIGILANHEPVLASWSRPSCACTARRRRSCASRRPRAICSSPRTARWCSSRRRSRPRSIDRATFEAKLAEARAAAERAEDGSEEQARALRDIRRYEAFLAVGQ